MNHNLNDNDANLFPKFSRETEKKIVKIGVIPKTNEEIIEDEEKKL